MEKPTYYSVGKTLPFYTTLAILQYFGYYQPQSKKFPKGLVAWTIIWMLGLLNLLVLIITRLHDGDYFAASAAIPFAIGLTVANLINLLFALKQDTWSKLFLSVTDFSICGTPTEHLVLKQKSDKVAKFCVYFLTAFMTFLVVMALLLESNCLKGNDKEYICGLLLPVWWPSGFEVTLLTKRFFLGFQLVISLATIPYIFIAGLQYQVLQYIVAKVRHISQLIKTVPHQNSVEQSRNFNVIITYHNHILDVSYRFNLVCRGTFGHVTLTIAVVIAFWSYHFIAGDVKCIAYIFIYLGNLWFLCHTGQKLEEQAAIIGNSFYSSDWQRYSRSIGKTIPFVLLRSQKQVTFDAVPIGALNYEFFFAVIKSVFSFISLLNQTL